MQKRPEPKPYILQIEPYVGGKSKAGEGVKVVKLSSNETPLGPSPKAKAAFIANADTLHRYPDGNATALRQAIAHRHDLPAEQIICGAGSDELIGLLIHAFAGPGDNIVISEHGFLMYKIYAQSFGADVVVAPEKNIRTDVDAMLAAVTDNTKIVFVANPNNPTGSYISTEEMQRLHNGLPPHVILAIDGAYAEYPDVTNFSDGSELVDKYDNVIMLRTFSKIYGLSALRIGWAYAAPHIIDVMNRIRGPFNVSSASISTAIAAIEDISFTAATRSYNNRELKSLETSLRKLGLTVHPSIANFVLVEFPEGKHNAANANNWLMARGLIVREVKNYGLPKCLRISIGLSEDNQAVINTLGEFLQS